MIFQRFTSPWLALSTSAHGGYHISTTVVLQWVIWEFEPHYEREFARPVGGSKYLEDAAPSHFSHFISGTPHVSAIGTPPLKVNQADTE